jgi:competence protein ComEA
MLLDPRLEQTVTPPKEIYMTQFRISFLALVALVASAMLGVSAMQPEDPININTATEEQLTELPRIGEVTAARIVKWREENGPFASTEELMNVQGIGERLYERIRPHVTVEDRDRDRSPGAPSRTD